MEPVTLNHGEEVTIGVYARMTLFLTSWHGKEIRDHHILLRKTVVASGEYDILDNDCRPSTTAD